MVISEQMEKTVHEQDIQLTLQGAACQSRLSPGLRYRYDNVAEDVWMDGCKGAFPERKREHISDAVLAAIPPVQCPEHAVAGKKDAYFCIGHFQELEHNLKLFSDLPLWQSPLLLAVSYPDYHRVSCPPGIPCRDSLSDGGICRSI